MAKEIGAQRMRVVTLTRLPGQQVPDQVKPINEQEIINLNIRKIEVLDGVTANRQLTKEILGRGLIVNDPGNKNIYIIDRNLDDRLKAQLAHNSKIIEDRIERTLPKQIFTFQNPMVKAKDCIVCDETVTFDTGNFVASPIIDGIPVFVHKRRGDITFYQITNEGLVPLQIQPYFENVVDDLEDQVTFFCAFVGIIVKKEEWYSQMILVDYINNGTDISKLPYADRYVHLHDLGSLLVSDAFSVIKISSVGEFIKNDAEKKPFFLIDMKHSNDGNAPLMVPVVFKDVEADPDRIVFGSIPEDPKPADEKTDDTDIEVGEKHAVVENPVAGTTNTKLDIAGLHVCVTGKWENGLNRDGVKVLIEKLGGKWTTTVNTKTNLLVIAPSPGKNKIEAADLLGVKKIKMEDFVRMTA